MFKSTLVKSASLFVAAAAAGFILSDAVPAKAAKALVPASACWVDTDYMGDYTFDRGIVNNSGGIGARPRRVVCPIPDNATNPRSGITSMLFDGFDGDNNPQTSTDISHTVLAHVCLQKFSGDPRDATSIQCSADAQGLGGTSTGPFDASVTGDAITLLHNESDFVDAYANLFVQITSNGTVGKSQFYGFTTF